MDLGGRKVLFKALVGSHNYNLNTPDSDRDYKLFVCPTFDDLYFKKQFSDSYVGEVDYGAHDVRHVSHLWWKANVNFLEVLFSVDFLFNDEVSDKTKFLLLNVYDMKEELARMNLPYLYDACVGMHINKKRLVEKATSGTQHLLDEFGFDTKQAMHSLRILDFLERYAKRKFSNFKEAIWYEDGEKAKDFLLEVKHGKYSKEKYYEFAEKKLKVVEGLKPTYKSQTPDEKTKHKLVALTKEVVRLELFGKSS